MPRQLSGVTLLEVLVTVSLIGILASVITVNLSSARVVARDTQRKADIDQIRTALELYYNDHRAYPPIELAQSNPMDVGWSNLQSALLTYLNTLPVDPGAGQAGYRYRSQGIGPASCADQWYVLEFQLENAGDSMILETPPVKDCTRQEYPSILGTHQRMVGVGVSAL